MKKPMIILLLFTILLTGCTKVTQDVAKIDNTPKETQNLIVEENLEEQESIIQTEDEFVAYIDSINYHVEAITTKESLTVSEQKTLENTFITLTDFIFYNGTINGKAFNELTTSAQEEVLSIYEKIDQKIESKIPGYKEKIAETATKTYENIKIKTEELKETIKNKYIEDFGQERYDQVEKSYDESKEFLTKTAKDTYNVIIDVTSDFYEQTKNKAENWYKNYKESRN